MALGSQDFNSDNELLFLKIIGLKGDEKVRFSVAKPKGEKQEGKKREYEQLPDTRSVSGNLFRAKLREYQWEGQTKYEVQIYLKDDEAKQTYIVACNVSNSIGRNLLNTLINLDGPKGGVLELIVWNKKDNGRPALKVTYDKNRVEWKYSPAEQNAFIAENSVRKGGKTVIERDYFDLEKKLMEEFQEKVVSEYGTPSNYSQSNGSPSQPAEPEGASDDPSDDLPF